MKTNKEEIDQIIKETLTQEEAKFYDELGEQNILQKVGSIFQGKLKWLFVIMNIAMLFIFGILIYCTIQFFDVVESTTELIRWGFGIIICMSAISMLKLFAWMQMDKNDILRELKRLELQVAAMATKTKN
jgi:hypothetical protein